MNRKAEPSTPLPNQIQEILDYFFERRPDLITARDGLIQTYQAVSETFEAGGILYLCGNGGSFADAMHIKGELTKSFEEPRPIASVEVLATLQQSETGIELTRQLEQGFPVIVLGESHSLRSAFENDKVGQFSYAQELNAFAGHIKRGVLLGISTSGSAKNVIAAAILAGAYGMTTVGFTGPAGGSLTEMVDIAWRAPGDSTAAIQENQTPLYHGLCRMIEAHFFG